MSSNSSVVYICMLPSEYVCKAGMYPWDTPYIVHRTSYTRRKEASKMASYLSYLPRPLTPKVGLRTPYSYRISDQKKYLVLDPAQARACSGGSVGSGRLGSGRHRLGGWEAERNEGTSSSSFKRRSRRTCDARCQMCTTACVRACVYVCLHVRSTPDVGMYVSNVAKGSIACT